MTDLEFQTAQDIARLDNAIGALQTLETGDVQDTIAGLKAVRQRLRRSLEIRAPRSDAGKSRAARTDAQGKLV